MRWGLATLIAFALCFTATAEAAQAEVDARHAARIASTDPNVVREREEHGELTRTIDKVDGNWEVGWYAGGERVALVIVDPATGVVRESWTGYQVAWKMARGYPGAFGHKLNAPYVFLPLMCPLPARPDRLEAALVQRHPRPARPPRLRRLPPLLQPSGDRRLRTPLQYLPLAYLFARALWIGLRGRDAGIRPVWPATWLLLAALFLVGFRVGLNVADSGVIDVGYAGVVGADHAVHGEPVYGNFPTDVSQGDTYGPVNYYSYVPFERIWPWSGT